MKERDYHNYDTLSVTVKKKRLQELTDCYAALGWENISMNEDGTYDDIAHLSLRRPHKIANKDQLQLMQVYMESAWNKIGKYLSRPCPVTIALSVIFGLLTLGSAIASVCLIFLTSGMLLRYVGLGLGALAVATVAVLIPVLIVTHGKERKKANRELDSCKRELYEICEHAQKLTFREDTDEGQ